MKNIQIFIYLLSLLSLWVQQARADKGEHHLFNPTPDSLLRSLSTDRPDTTESPYTVDAGHFQIELDFVRFTLNDDSGQKDENFSYLPINFKIGLTNSIDLQIVPESYVYQKSKPRSTKQVSRSGFGDTTLRLKYNLFGNDQGDSALAIMPYVTLPTARNNLGADRMQGGLIVPFGYDFSERLGVGVMAEWDYVNDQDSNYHSELLTSATLGYDFSETIGGYVELVAIFPDQSEFDDTEYLDLGLTYALNSNTQLDAGVNFGLAQAASDLTLFSGLSFRY